MYDKLLKKKTIKEGKFYMPKAVMNIPEFALSFNCNPKLCNDKCCNKFNMVYISEKNYKAILACKNSKIKEIAEKHVKINEEANTKFEYAYIEPNGNCAFLDENEGCLIKSIMGEQHMGDPCSTYPKVYISIGGELDIGVSPCCPLILKEMLNLKSGVKFTKIQRNLNKDFTGRKYQDVYKRYEQFIPQLKQLAIKTMQNKNFTIPERLLIMQTLFNHLDYLFDKKDPKRDKFLKIYTNDLSNEECTTLLKEFQTTYKEQFILSYLIYMHVFHPQKESKLKELFEFISEFSDDVEISNMDETVKKYKEAYEKYYKPFEEKYGYKIENLLVNECFRNAIPFLYFRNMSDSVLFLTIYYSIIKFLICMDSLKTQSEISEERAFDLIYEVVKKFEAVEHYYENGYEGTLTNIRLIFMLSTMKIMKLKSIHFFRGLFGKIVEQEKSSDEEKIKSQEETSEKNQKA